MSVNKKFYSSDRIEALSDGIFAIAMTILILNIHAPDKETVDRIGLLKALLNNAIEFYTYFLSFLLLGIFWIIQRRQMSIFIKTDQKHMWLTIFLLMFICLVPFSASLQSDYSNDTVAAFIFCFNMFVIGLFFLGIWHYATKNHRLVSADFSREKIITGRAIVITFVFVFMLVMASTFIIPAYSGMILILIPLMKFITRKIFRAKEEES